MRGTDINGKIHNFTPTPPTAEELVVIKAEHEKRLQELYDSCDDRIVTATLHYFKTERAIPQLIHDVVGSNARPIYSIDTEKCWGSCVMIGTERQQCRDSEVLNITGSYTINLTDEYIKMYEANDNQLVITNK